MNVDRETKNFNNQVFIKDSLICRGKDLSINNEFFEEDDLFKSNLIPYVPLVMHYEIINQHILIMPMINLSMRV